MRLDTGLSLSEAKAVVEEIFARLERGEINQREVFAENISKKGVYDSDVSVKDGLKKAGKGALVVGGLAAYMGLGVIGKLTSKYIKK